VVGHGGSPKYVGPAVQVVCMYVCMYRGIYVRAAAYSLNCHGGAMIYRMLYKTFQSLVERRTESVTSMNHGLGTGYEVAFVDAVSPGYCLH